MIIMITTMDDTVYVIILYDIYNITYHTDYYQNTVFLVVWLAIIFPADLNMLNGQVCMVFQ